MPFDSQPIPTKKTARLVDVAKAAGVSHPVVSAVLLKTRTTTGVSEKTAQRIRKVALRLGFCPNYAAQQLAGKSSRLIGVLFPAVDFSQIALERLRVMEQEAFRRNYRFMIGQLYDPEADLPQYVDDFVARRVSAVFSFAAHSINDGSILSKLQHVVIGNETVWANQYSVCVDTADGFFQAVCHLVKRGRKRIALLSAHLRGGMIQRKEGYEKGLKVCGQPIDSRLIWAGKGDNNPSKEQMKDAADFLIDREKADSVVVSNDEWAVAFMKELKRRGLRIPQDVSITGYDNLDISRACDPELTTVDQQNEEFSRCALDLLIHLIEKGALPNHKRQAKIKPRLIIREST
ncbi:MAG: LacI family DNA-binding transcriptional regulator [Verrucomicrobiae bacterium]|nr:LacI family DNA-binding transcriptional regulator [Verrucomicrobiae bacterium]